MVEFNATFLTALLSFALFIIIMNAIFYKPVLSIIRKRENYINSNYDKAQDFTQKTRENENIRCEKIEQTQRKCRKEIQNIVNLAHEEANKKTQEAREKSKAEILSGKDKLTRQEKELEETVNNTVVNDLASSITSKISGAEIPVKRN